MCTFGEQPVIEGHLPSSPPTHWKIHTVVQSESLTCPCRKRSRNLNSSQYLSHCAGRHVVRATRRWCAQAERAAQQRAEEAAERARLMEEYAAADRVEQLSQQRARLRVADHRRQVEALLAAKRATFEQEQVRVAMEKCSREYVVTCRKGEGGLGAGAGAPFTMVIILMECFVSVC